MRLRQSTRMLLRLICLDESLINGPGYLTAGESHRVGRSSRCSFVVNDLSVSRIHAELVVNDASVFVKDRDSRNGTFVEGVRIAEAEVRPGQSLRFGNSRFQLLVVEEPLGAHANSEISTYVSVPESA